MPVCPRCHQPVQRLPILIGRDTRHRLIDPHPHPEADWIIDRHGRLSHWTGHPTHRGDRFRIHTC